jgi:ATP-dependent Lon protease
MSSIQNPTKLLPESPSAEYLRKEAKRIARAGEIQLAAAQRRIAHDYGYRNWAELMNAVVSIASGSGAGAPGQRAGSGSSSIWEAGTKLLPMLPLRELVAFPHVSYPIFIGRPRSMNAVRYAKEQSLSIVLATQKDGVTPEPLSADIYAVGTLATLIDAMPMHGGNLRIVVEPKRRARILRFVLDEDFYKAEAEEIEEPALSDARLASLVSAVISALARHANILEESAARAMGTTAERSSALADRIASEMQMDIKSKQELLELLDPAGRLEKLWPV